MALFCVYIYYVFRRKVGPLGPQGFQGNPVMMETLVIVTKIYVEVEH